VKKEKPARGGLFSSSTLSSVYQTGRISLPIIFVGFGVEGVWNQQALPWCGDAGLDKRARCRAVRLRSFGAAPAACGSKEGRHLRAGHIFLGAGGLPAEGEAGRMRFVTGGAAA
jgi:hypothetical protein